MDHERKTPSIIYVIGASDEACQEISKRIHTQYEGTQIVFVDKIEDVPEDDRPKSNPFNEREVFPIRLERIPPIPEYFQEKRKGHERPYKFHR